MTDIDVDGLLTIIGAVILLAGGYGVIIGPYQKEIADAVYQWYGTPSRSKPIVNFGIGMALATILTGAAALYVTDWRLLGAGLIAGLFSSTQAAKGHDQEAAKVQAAKAGEQADEAYEQGRQDTIAAIRQHRQQQTQGGDHRRAA